MKLQVTLEISARQMARVDKFLFGTRQGELFSTRSCLTLEALLELLLDHIAQMFVRPRCREADAMSQLLVLHGYRGGSECLSCSK
jgi:hypothetical protein